MKNGVTHLNLGFPLDSLSPETIREIKEVYLCPSFSCNLKCPHCTLPETRNEKDLTDFFETFKTLKLYNRNINYNLFGGEPLQLKQETLDRLCCLLKTEDYVVSSNLLNLRKEHYKLLINAEWVDTSWNPDRLTQEQGVLWIKNIRKLQEVNIKVNLMVTLTDDLVKMNPKDFMEKVKIWKLYSLELDCCIGNDEQDMDIVHTWLYSLYKIWNLETKLNTVENLRNSIIHNSPYKDCSKTYTLLPSGNLNYACPYFEKEEFNNSCYSCEFLPFCGGGCILQKKCTLPKKLYKELKMEIENDTTRQRCYKSGCC